MGSSVAASAAVEATPVAAATAPDAPTGLSATPGDGRATISFTPGSNNGAAITNYEYSLDGGSYTALDPATPDSPITIEGLTNGTSYSITLRAINSVGSSVAGSAAVEVTPVAAATPPDAPTGLLATPGDGQATISFTPGADNGSPITGYRYIKDDGSVSSTILATTGISPLGIAMDAAGNVYTANGGSNTVSKITPEGISIILGTTGNDPKGIAIDAAGNIYTANTNSDTVSKITPDGSSTIFGATGSNPLAIAIDAAGNVYTANKNSDTVSKITPDGTQQLSLEQPAAPRRG